MTALINELAARPGEDEMVLVLDDYHLVGAGQVHASLAFLLEHLPPGLRLVLASRSDPPLPLPRLRAGGQLAELRAAGLRFTAEEAAALLREAIGADLPGPAVAALAARTEGGRRACSWPPCRCAGRQIPRGSWPRSAAATAMCWTTWPGRCSTARARRCAPSCWRPRCWSGCRGSCVMRSPAGPVAR